MSQDSVRIQLELATKAAEIALARVKKQTEDATASFNVFKGSFAAGFALDALKGMISGIQGFATSVIDESMKAEQSVRNMNVALEQAGLYSEATSQRFQDLGSELQKTTVYSEDASNAAVGLLASLTDLSADGIEQATRASADLAATLNIDLATASEMIAKAVNGNVTAFGKLGIEIQKGRTDSENLANTLAALSAQQGNAAKQAQTFQGAMTKLGNAKGEVLESLGNLIIKNPVFIRTMEMAANAALSLAEWIEKNAEDINIFTKALVGAVAIVGTITLAVSAFSAGLAGLTVLFGTIKAVATAAWLAITGPVGLIVVGIAAVSAALYALIKNWDTVKSATYDAMAATLEYAAVAAGVFSDKTKKSLLDQADAYREKAKATRESADALKAESDASSGSSGSNRGAKEAAELRAANQEKLNALNEYKAQRELIDQDYYLKSQEQLAAHEQVMYDLSGAYSFSRLEKELQENEQRLLARQEYEQRVLEAQIEANLQKNLLIEDDLKREQALRDGTLKADLDRAKLGAKQELEVEANRNKSEAELAKQRIADRKSTFATIAGLASANNKELATIGKAFAVYQVAQETPIAISKALSSAPPPFNFALAGLVGAAMAQQAARAAGLNFEDGGIVPGTSYRGDNVAANVNSGEMIINREQQSRLFKMANGENGSGSLADEVRSLSATVQSLVNQPMIVQVDGKELFNITRAQLASGRTF